MAHFTSVTFPATELPNATTSGPIVWTYAIPNIVYISVAVQIGLIAVIFLGNSYVIVLMARFRRLRSCSNYLTGSMAVSDFLLSLALIPGVKITFDPSFVSDVNVCTALWCSQVFASSMSVFSLLCISLDRLLKICKPLRYPSIVTERGTVYTICVIWAYGVCTILVPPFAGLRNSQVSCFDFSRFFNYYHIHYLFVCNGLLPFITLLVIYGYLFSIVREKRRTAINHEPAASGNEAASWRKELKTLITLAVIVGFTGVAWLPSITLVMLDLHFPMVHASLTWRTVLSWLTYMNSAVNPILYALRSEPFKSASKELISKDLSSLFTNLREMRSNRVHPSTVS